MEHITEAKTVEGKVSVWAIPQTEWADGGTIFTGKWKYELRTDSPYNTGAVKVCEELLFIAMPAGINLAVQALETLEEAKRKETEQHYERIRKIEEQCRMLRQLTYQGSNESTEPEIILVNKEESDDIPF